ncbi:DUF2399 domain-containing protein, partial [Actinomadura sp. 7K507]
PTPWDPSLATAMEDRTVRVEEEQVLPDLLTDLGTRTAAPRRGSAPSSR